LILGLGLDAHAVAATSSVQIRAISHNMEGAWTAWRDGPVIAHGRGNPPSPASLFSLLLAELDGGFAPQIVTLQEVCFVAEYPYLQQQMGQRGYQLAFAPIRAANSQCLPASTPDCSVAHSCDFGLVLAVKGGLDAVRAIAIGGDYTDGTDRQFKLLCGELTIAGLGTDGIAACVTHLRANLGSSTPAENAPFRATQTANIAEELAAYMNQGKLVVLGGDMNAKPDTDELDHLYTIQGATGVLYEADQIDPRYFTSECLDAGRGSCRTGELTESAISAHSDPTAQPGDSSYPYWATLADRTYGLKYDYVFYGAPDHTRFTDFSAACVRDAHSDHGLYRAAALYTAAGGAAAVSASLGGPHCEDP
jgi:exonuclease III